jgi:hypothetical protein
MSIIKNFLAAGGDHPECFIDEFTRGYIEGALWSSTDPNTGEPLDKHHDIRRITQRCLRKMIEVCRDFQVKAHHLLVPDNWTGPSDALVSFLWQAGFHFWLTQAGHGIGFWDGDWQEPAATSLCDLSDNYPEMNLFIDDDGGIDYL